MGLLRFAVSPPGRLTAEMVEQCCVSGLDRVPWRIQPRQEGNLLLIERDTDDSANLHVPWDIPGQGRLMLSTASLMERPEPYQLPLELARGKIGQLRNQMAEWQSLGLVVSEATSLKLAEALARFGRAAITADEWWEDSATMAEQALAAAVEASALLAACYTDQAIAVRRRINGALPVVFGANLGLAPLDDGLASAFLLAFQAAVVPFNWRDVESVEGAYAWNGGDQQLQWCRERGVQVYSGPLVQFDRLSVPDWLYAWEGDFDRLLDLSAAYVEQVVLHCRGQVDVWQCAGRMHSTDALALSEEERLRLTARAIEITRALDPEVPVLVSFDQPWGEYLCRRECDFPPLQFADALIRAGLRLNGFALEINLGGSLPRDAVDLSRQLDYWAVLGLPLHVVLTIPSDVHDDPLASRPVGCATESWTPALQQAWVARWLPMLLAKPYVAGVFWNQLRDSEPHEFPHCGLYDVRRSPKPALRTLASFCQGYLK